MMNATAQDVSLWEVWIEYDQFHPEYFGTLYVHGEIWADEKDGSLFTRIAADQTGELKLQLPPGSHNPICAREVVYSEPIRNLNQYKSVSIYSGSELIGCFHDIEIMI